MITAMATTTTDNSTEMAVVMSIPKTNKAGNELQEIFISDGEEFPRKKLKVNILLESSIYRFDDGKRSKQ